MQEKDVNIKTGFAPSVFIRFTYDFFTRNAKTCSFFFCCCCCFVKIKFFQVFMLSITLYMLMVFILLLFSYRTQTRIIFILTIIISLYLLAWLLYESGRVCDHWPDCSDFFFKQTHHLLLLILLQQAHWMYFLFKRDTCITFFLH